MKVYPTEKIRNIALVGHVGSGKTSLTEAMLFNAGHTTRLGKVDEGNTVTDFLPEETKRKITVSTTMAPVEWKDHKINLLDTPGFADFYGEVKGALRAVDTLIMVLCGVSGVEVQTEIIWEDADKLGLPRIAFVNKLERENASYFQVINQMKENFEVNIVPIQLPIGQEASFCGIVDLLSLKAYQWDNDGKYKEIEIPGNMADDVETYREQIIEAAAEADDDLLNKYLEGEELTEKEIYKGFKLALRKGSVVPVLCGSATKNIGIQPVLDLLVNVIPSPAEMAETEDKNIQEEPFSALVFKTQADAYVGKLTYFRILTGNLKSDSTVFNANKEKDEKIAQLLIMRGKNQDTAPELKAGDIAAVAKLSITTTGDTLCAKSDPVILEGIEFPEPKLTIAVEPKTKSDEDKLGSAINRLKEEDPSFRWAKNNETRQNLLTGMGETHLDILIERLQRKFGVEINTLEPKVPYRETIRSTVKVEGKHKKQTGGHGQYGHVWLEIGPNPESDFEFTESIFGGSVPKQYVPAVEKGLREGLQEGVLAGFPVTGIKVNLYDGSYHPVDSNELSFKMAAIIALRKGLEQAKPVLLEPIVEVEVTVPEQFMGDIIGDLNTKRGRILGMEPSGKNQIIKAQVPAAEMQRYTIDLKAITQGRGSFTMKVIGYEETPSNIAEKVIAARKAEKEE